MPPENPRVEELIGVLTRPLAEMPEELALCPVPGAFDVVVRPPGSKSLTNRALLLAALATGDSVLRGCLLDADDAKVMIAALRMLGATITVSEKSPTDNEVRIKGVGGRFRGGCELNLNNAGTATRFLTAAACLADSPVVIDGNARMRERPIGELVGLLRKLGVRIEELGKPGCVPLRVHPCRLDGGSIDVGVTLSSQYVSALMLLAPWMVKGLEVRFTAPPTSPSYIDMTLALLRRARLGQAERDTGWTRANVRVGGRQGLPGLTYDVEPDASGATYFWGAAAVVPGSACRIDGLDAGSFQGDAAFCGELATALGGGEIDLTLMPDTAMTAAAVACFASGVTTLRGLRTLRVKETDRLAALQTELTKIGVKVDIESYAAAGGVSDELLRITPPQRGLDCSPDAARVVFDTYDDHRMAMSLAIIGLRRPNVVIRDPKCVAKTYPGFWKDWAALYEKALGAGQ
jgi:3-phosphoshikimate 1-carboxyvinyltransferase